MSSFGKFIRRHMYGLAHGIEWESVLMTTRFCISLKGNAMHHWWKSAAVKRNVCVSVTLACKTAFKETKWYTQLESGA